MCNDSEIIKYVEIECKYCKQLNKIKENDYEMFNYFCNYCKQKL